MARLTINIATRGRPELLRWTLEQSLPRMGLLDSTMMVSVDEDDQPTLDSLKLLPKDSRLLISVKPREDSRGEKYDRALTEAPADVYLLATDYGAIHTPGFDEKILEAASIWPDGIGCVYTNMCDELVPMLQAPTAKYAEKVGLYGGPGYGCLANHAYPFWFIDHETADLAWMIGRVNFADVTVSQVKRPKTTTRLRDLAFWAGYYEFMVLERRGIAKGIIMDPEFQAPDWLKKQLCNWHPLVEMRSRSRNGRVIHGASSGEQARGEQGPPDEGYVRSKQRAELKMTQLYGVAHKTTLRVAA